MEHRGNIGADFFRLQKEILSEKAIAGFIEKFMVQEIVRPDAGRDMMDGLANHCAGCEIAKFGF
jgi:hypothetical protein